DLHRTAELDGAGDDRPVGKRERELAGLLVPRGPDQHERAVALVVVQPPVLVDEPEPPDAAGRELDRLRVRESERLDRRDGDPGNDGGHAATLVTARSRARRPRPAA